MISVVPKSTFTNISGFPMVMVSPTAGSNLERTVEVSSPVGEIPGGHIRGQRDGKIPSGAKPSRGENGIRSVVHPRNLRPAAPRWQTNWNLPDPTDRSVRQREYPNIC